MTSPRRPVGKILSVSCSSSKHACYRCDVNAVIHPPSHSPGIVGQVGGRRRGVGTIAGRQAPLQVRQADRQEAVAGENEKKCGCGQQFTSPLLFTSSLFRRDHLFFLFCVFQVTRTVRYTCTP